MIKAFETSRKWISGTLGEAGGERRVPTGPPISFRYGGIHSGEFLSRWEKTYDAEVVDADITLHRCTYRDSRTGLVCLVEMKEYADFPAAEWVVRFKNTGSADSLILEDVQALDIAWESFSKEIVLHHSRGSEGQFNDFFYTQDILFRNETFHQSQSLRLTPGGGRSSIERLPFFNVQTGDKGVILAIGWSGEWAAEFSDANATQVRIRAGMDKTHLKLLPGEEIRTPSILLLFWQGTPLDGNNLLRRLLLKYKTPHVDGKPATGPICSLTWGGMKTEAHIERITAYKKHGLAYDCYWVDAGWYGVDETECPDVFVGDWAKQAGNWNINRYRHPDGLRPIADAAHAAGLKFLLWFEPERARPGTQIPREHPDWFFGDVHAEANLLLNLGNADALNWAVEMVSGYVTELGLDWYRQDFNMDPLASWRAADASDRQGISEIRHIEGLYAFWNELRRRHPDLMIDNCASGGRRLDIETISRSICLWPSDYPCFTIAKADAGQIRFGGLSYWMPSHAGQALAAPPGDTYAYRSTMSSAFVDQQFIYEVNAPTEEYPWDWHRRRLDEQKRLQPYFHGDFYPLAPISISQENWMAYAMHRPDLDAGFLMAFRREKSPFQEATFVLPGLNPEIRYRLEDADTAKTWTVRGEDLIRQGVPVLLGRPRESRLILYHAVGDPNTPLRST